MISSLDRPTTKLENSASSVVGMVHYLRQIVLSDAFGAERFHAIFLDARRNYLADVSLGLGNSATLTLRMRELFARALAVGAEGLVVAHNHPSGDCRPSANDISATLRLKEIAGALDIELIDHLILTERSVYSMRAGGDL